MSGHVDLLKATRAEIVNLLKRQGNMSVESLAAELAISRVAVRRHLDQLEERGFIVHCSERCDRGRPRFLYSLTTEGNGLFPDTSGEFACGLLDQIGRTFGDGAVDSVLREQATTLIESIKTRVDGLPFDERVRAVAREFNERGYVTDVEPLDDGSFRIVEHNCPIREVAEQYPRVCSEELRIYEEITGGTIIKSECRIATGATSCEYRVLPAPAPNARPLPVFQYNAATVGGSSYAEPVAFHAAQTMPAPYSKKHQMAVCVNVHCALNGAEELVEHIVLNHGVEPDVESYRGLKLELTYCFGMCDSGPNVEIDGEFYDGMTAEQLDSLILGLE